MTNADVSAENPGGSEQSFRFIVIPTVGGTKERVRFSNAYGTTPVTIGAARLAVGQDGSAAIDAAHEGALSFNGQPSVTIAPGTVVSSDPVEVSFAYGQALAVSVYLKGAFGPVSRHNSLFMTNYRTAVGDGDHTTDATGTEFKQSHTEWLLLNGVDVYGTYQGTIAVFGSSTTDGFHSNYSSDKVYPTPNTVVPGQHDQRLADWLARRLHAAGYQIGVVNLGVPGDTITPDSTNQTNNVKNANERIAQDVFTLPNLLGVVTYFGSIDIRSADCKSAPEVETSTLQMVNMAATAKVPVVLATIPPSAFCTNPAKVNYGPFPSASDPYAGGSTPGPVNGGETQRIALNAWIRSVGATTPGVIGIADFDQALSDPARPNFLQAPFNSGDNYHPTGAGYHAEADTIPYALLLKH